MKIQMEMGPEERKLELTVDGVMLDEVPAMFAIAIMRIAGEAEANPWALLSGIASVMEEVEREEDRAVDI